MAAHEADGGAAAGTTRRGDAARLQLIGVAEQLFAERGIEAVSLRDVSASAGQRNHSAAQYHFGDRRGLVAAVYLARMARVDRLRNERMAELTATGMEGDLPSLVEAAVAPLVEVVAETGGWYGRFLARTRWDTFASAVVAELDITTGLRLVRRRLIGLLDDLPLPVRHHRLDQLTTLVVGTVASWEWAEHRGRTRLDRDELVADLVATGTALLRAPATTSSRAPSGASLQGAPT